MLAMVPGIGYYLGLIDGGYGLIEEIKTPAVAGALMSRLSIRQLIKILVGYRSFHQPRLPAPLH